jgi:hypothetical protein
LISRLESSKNPEDIPKLPAAYVALYNGFAVEIRQALKTRRELLGEDGEGKKAWSEAAFVFL